MSVSEWNQAKPVYHERQMTIMNFVHDIMYAKAKVKLSSICYHDNQCSVLSVMLPAALTGSNDNFMAV